MIGLRRVFAFLCRKHRIQRQANQCYMISVLVHLLHYRISVLLKWYNENYIYKNQQLDLDTFKTSF